MTKTAAKKSHHRNIPQRIVTVPDELWSKLERLAKAHYTTLSGMVVKLINEARETER